MDRDIVQIPGLFYLQKASEDVANIEQAAAPAARADEPAGEQDGPRTDQDRPRTDQDRPQLEQQKDSEDRREQEQEKQLLQERLLSEQDVSALEAVQRSRLEHDGLSQDRHADVGRVERGSEHDELEMAIANPNMVISNEVSAGAAPTTREGGQERRSSGAEVQEPSKSTETQRALQSTETQEASKSTETQEASKSTEVPVAPEAQATSECIDTQEGATNSIEAQKGAIKSIDAPNGAIISIETQDKDAESDRDSDSDSVSDDILVDRAERERLLELEDGGHSDEGDAKTKEMHETVVMRTKNEVEPSVLPYDKSYVLPNDMALVKLGAVADILDNVVILKADASGDYQVFDEGTYVFREDRSILGVMFETFGRVTQPMYSLRFPSRADIDLTRTPVGGQVFVSPTFCRYVFTQALRDQKGSDASNLHDEEVGDAEQEFSDDEKEAQFRRQQKRSRNQDRRPASHHA